MKDIQIFNNPEFGELRTIEEGDKIYFVATDAARMLGYAKPSNAVSAHCKGALKRGIPTSGGVQQMNVIPEGDLYRLIANSELPSAEKFESWVFDEVLPTIRKTGSYQKPLSQLEILQGSINQLVEQNKRLSRVEMKQEEQDRQMSHINTSIEVLNGVCTEGTKCDRLNAMVRAYANKAGLTYPTAWHKFCEAFNFAFHTNIGLLITNYMKKQAINKKMSTPVYLEAAERLDDALRVAEKMLNSLPGKVARA